MARLSGLVYAGNFAGAAVLAGMFAGQNVPAADFGRFLLWSTLGNAVGGSVFVALIKYGHAQRD